MLWEWPQAHRPYLLSLNLRHLRPSAVECEAQPASNLSAAYLIFFLPPLHPGAQANES